MLFGGFCYHKQGVVYGSYVQNHSSCSTAAVTTPPWLQHQVAKERGIQQRISHLGIGQLADQLTPKSKLLELRYLHSYHLSVLGSFGNQLLEFLQSRRMKTLLLSCPGRKWREKNTLGGTGKWQVEVGEPTSPLLGALESELITESSSNVCKGLQVPLYLNYLVLCLQQ